jgi:FemAB-related protein (PEP-CTERM system-associated)
LADELDVRYLELRNQNEIIHPALTEKKTSKVLMWRELPSSADELWKSFKPEVRNQIRKAEKHELVVQWGTLDALPSFYDVFAQNMRDLGTPVFGIGLFRAILEKLPGRSEVCLVRLGEQAIAGALLLHGAGFTEVPSASSLREHNKTCANMLMYHHLLLRAQERGQSVFDFGRSSMDSGTFKFKKQWRAEPHPSIWQYYVRQGSISEVRPDNPKYQRKIETWKRLPLWLTKLIGPTIIRGIP